LFFATRRIWADDIRRVIQPIRLQDSSYTANDYIIIRIVFDLNGHNILWENMKCIGVRMALIKWFTTRGGSRGSQISRATNVKKGI
jgi:hypothetical protein